jgi:hypothetical protein
MEIGAFFILVIVLMVVAALGGGFYALTMWLRHKQLDPEEDKIEDEPQGRGRPEHVEVESEQNARFVGSR